MNFSVVTRSPSTRVGRRSSSSRSNEPSRPIPRFTTSSLSGRPSQRRGSEVVAIVQLIEGASTADHELVSVCAGRIARYKVLKAFIRTQWCSGRPQERPTTDGPRASRRKPAPPQPIPSPRSRQGMTEGIEKLTRLTNRNPPQEDRSVSFVARVGSMQNHHVRIEHSAPRGLSSAAATTPSTDKVQRRWGVSGPDSLLATTIAQDAGSASVTSNVQVWPGPTCARALGLYK